MTFATRSEIGQLYRGIENGKMVLTDAFRRSAESCKRASANDSGIVTCPHGSTTDAEYVEVEDAIAMDDDQRNEMLQKMYDECRGKPATAEIPPDPRLNDLPENAAKTLRYGRSAMDDLYQLAAEKRRRGAR